jgi:dihydroorotate dehydrogenase (NAD+) catalytic subunit
MPMSASTARYLTQKRWFSMTDRPDLSVTIAGVRLKNPVIAASGTYGFGREYAEMLPIDRLGAIAVKGLTLQPKCGNPPPRIAETPMGIINSIGLQNPGVESFLKNDLPWLKGLGIPVIANVAGSTVEEYGEISARLADTEVDMVELNISCPNVKKGGVAFGVSCDSVEAVTLAARKALGKKPLIVKLTPNVTDITQTAKAAEAGGADALSLINTLLAMKIDVNTRRPILRQNCGGLSGPAIMPIAVRMVWQVAQAVKLPVIGMGGIMSGEDAAEFMLAGATAVSVGAATLADPFAPLRIIDELEAYLIRQKIKAARELTGAVIAY